MKYYFTMAKAKYPIQNTRIIAQLKQKSFKPGEILVVVDAVKTSLKVLEINQGEIVFECMDSSFIDRRGA
jgi:hypothetical protein